ncbi:phosphotransferase family protein [Actinopolymorpha pittospori]
MSAERRFADVEHLTAIARAAVGERRLAGVERLRGGTKKGVYRLLFDDDFSVIIYSWDTDENYWPTRPDDEPGDYADPFSPASGFDLFEAAHARLSTLGVRVPRVYLADRGRQIFPADVAVVEDVRGATLESRLQEDPQASRGILARLGESLGVMHECPAPTFGKVALVDRGGRSRGGSCEEVVLRDAVDDLAEAASRDRRMTGAMDELDEVLHNLAAEVRPRSRHGLIHGELGPDHVLVDGQGEPVLKTSKG